ncbi:MAG: hypothetical protein ABTQ32_00950 [Myxococcaceae bacterium]
MPKELDVMVVVGAGSSARVAQWRIVSAESPPVTFEAIDVMSPPPNVTSHALSGQRSRGSSSFLRLRSRGAGGLANEARAGAGSMPQPA